MTAGDEVTVGDVGEPGRAEDHGEADRGEGDHEAEVKAGEQEADGPGGSGLVLDLTERLTVLGGGGRVPGTAGGGLLVGRLGFDTVGEPRVERE